MTQETQPDTPPKGSRARNALGAGAVVAVFLSILYAPARKRLTSFDPVQWRNHQNRHWMDDDVVAMIGREEIVDEVTAERRLGRPDEVRTNARNETVWQYYLGAGGECVHLLFDGAGRLAGHKAPWHPD